MLQGVVIRGTNPEHEFELPYPVELVEEVRVIYGQNNKSIFTKTRNDCVLTEGKITVSLSQEETFLFVPSKILNIEIRIKLTNGKVTQTDEPVRLRVLDSMDMEAMD